ncbi:O-acyltransferase like protein-like [Trichogramma pretiosum]|uniref:O-acyltransferase like protein-like n=1 Tax=Trichogramma pretiosum TaxID=7493 RepID=UPI0006C9C75A|nr:O-acyltransferase like protein-like [Trichogramma pretiosum]XP_014232928.1 O-acyltransferase like protein-like [Trichogramma pretiosum]
MKDEQPWHRLALLGLALIVTGLSSIAVEAVKSPLPMLHGGAAGLNEDDVMSVLEAAAHRHRHHDHHHHHHRNQTSSRRSSTSERTENFTLSELIEAVGAAGPGRSTITTYEQLAAGRGPVDLKSTHTNPYYDFYEEQIDLEAKRFLDLVPAFEPGVGPVSPQCKRQSDVYRRELNKFTLWALKMFDATAKMPSGLLNGNVNQLGDYDECVGVEGPDQIRGQYCLAYLRLDVDESRPDLRRLHKLLHSHYAFRSNMSDPGHRVPRFGTINWAVCTPAACSAADVEASLRHQLARHQERTGLRIQVKVEQEMCQTRRAEPLPTETILVGLLFLGVVLTCVCVGLCEHYELATVHPALSAFSLKRNALKLFSLERPQGDIATLHGIRALNAFMLILAHKSLALFFNPYTNRTDMTEYVGKPWTVIGRAASLYTDPFIMLSGLLTAYSFLGRLSRTGKLDIRSEYASRLFRIMPSLGALVLFCTFVMPFIGSGPQWSLVVTQHADICKKTWWRNFLFIHNYFGFENMCLTHTHHVGIDTQLFFLSPLMILAIYKRPRIGFAVLAALATISTALRFFVTYHYRLNNYVFFGTSIRQLFDTANLSYILPSHRLTVYILGVFVGYVLRNWPKNRRINDTIASLGWYLCIAMFLGAFFGPAGMGSIDYVYDPVHAATYNAFAPIGWCALFVWVTFVTHTGNSSQGWLSRAFSWRGFLVTTRLSYAVYLTQFPVFFYNVGQTRSAEYIGFIRMLLNIKELIWILLTSAILTLLFEMPFQNLRNYYVKGSKERPAAASATTEKAQKEIKAQ